MRTITGHKVSHHAVPLSEKSNGINGGEGGIDGSDKLSGQVEVDETYIGGRESNKHRNKKINAGRGAVGKSAVIGAKERNGRVKIATIDKTDALTLESFVFKNVQTGSNVFTDEHRGYSGLRDSFNHQSVKHSAGEYVNGMAHTNGIESFWSMLKRGYKGTYHKMSVKHLSRYVTEFAGRHNVRDLDTLAQMVVLAKGLDGKQLRYLDLTE